MAFTNGIIKMATTTKVKPNKNATEPTVKKRKQSKPKGNRFELEISKLMTEQLAPLKFIRSPQSGARVGGINFKKFGALYSQDSLNIFVGDVVCTNETEVGLTFKCNIECKSYGAADGFNLIMLGSSKIFGWMEESEVDAAKTDKTPVIIFKWNRTQTFVASPNLPEECTKMILNRQEKSPIKIGLLDDALKIKDFWF